MIPLFFNRLPVTLLGKVELLRKRALALYGSEVYNVGKDKFMGDNLTISSLFPDWVITEYKNNPSNVTIIPIIKNYLRWLFSQKYGYGALINWEYLRSPIFMDDKLVEGLAEMYFPGENFSSSELNITIANIRKFSINVDYHYFSKKGTAPAIKYVLVTLLGYDYDTTKVLTFSNCVIKIVANVSDSHKTFLEKHVVPAGNVIIYEAP
jgi:hypothetical protein